MPSEPYIAHVVSHTHWDREWCRALGETAWLVRCVHHGSKPAVTEIGSRLLDEPVEISALAGRPGDELQTSRGVARAPVRPWGITTLWLPVRPPCGEARAHASGATAMR